MRLLLAFLLAFLVSTPSAAEKRIALSFDDVPRHRGAIFSPAERTERLIAGLQQANVRQAVFFVVPGQLGHDDGIGGEERIAAYVAAGHVIADHSFSHRHLSAMSAADYLADIDKSEAWLKDRPGARPWFRYPFLDEGQEDKAKRDGVRAGLKARGLRNGYATIDGNDWQIESLVADVVKTGTPIRLNAVRDFYVETMVGAANFYDGLAVKAWGRHPAHVILLHESDIAALFITDLVDALRSDGWTIIGADEAYADPIGSVFPDVPSANGTLTELAAWEKGIPSPRWYERNDERLMKQAFDRQISGPKEP